MKIKEILQVLNSSFPIDTACDFDNVGLLVGDGENKVHKVLIALDCTLEMVKKAKENNCELIITHHPVIFSPLKSLLSGTVVYELASKDISVISMHTNLDIASGGVSETLCKSLKLKNITPYTALDGFTLYYGEHSPISAKSFAGQIKADLGALVKYVDGGKPIERVLVCSGSGGDFIDDAINGGFDALVTAEVKHHQFLAAKENRISIFDAGHFNTEDIIIEPLCKLLTEKFPNISFLTDHTSYIEYM